MGDKTLLITGMAGGLARLVGAEMQQRGYDIVGVDYRASGSDPAFPATVYRANYNKTKIEDIFRRHAPTLVAHLGRVGNLKERMDKRFDLNVIGSRKVMDLALHYGAKRMVVLSTFHIYGAYPNNHTPICEDEPVRAGLEFPQIADAIQLDSQALTWIYQNRACRAVLLRPSHVIGPDIDNTISRFLRSRRVLRLMGFDPMMQFIHQSDLTSAIVTALGSKVHGVFNVAGRGVLPWSKTLQAVGARSVPVPSSLASGYMKLASVFSGQLPAYIVNFFKYPCVISSERFRSTFDWTPSVGIEEALLSTVGRG